MSTPITGFVSLLALVAAVPALAEPHFNRIATLPVTATMADGDDVARETSAEIISASEDGMTLVYTDSPLGVIGLIDITDPHAPRALGQVEMGGACVKTPIRAILSQGWEASHGWFHRGCQPGSDHTFP